MKLTEQEQVALQYYRNVSGNYSHVIVALVDRLLAYIDKAEKYLATDAQRIITGDLLSPEDRARVEDYRNTPNKDLRIDLLVDILDKVAPKPVEPSVSFHEALSDMCENGAKYRSSDFTCDYFIYNGSNLVCVWPKRVAMSEHKISDLSAAKWTKVS